MQFKFYYLIAVVYILLGCKDKQKERIDILEEDIEEELDVPAVQAPKALPRVNTIEQRFRPPSNFQRKEHPTNSFAYHLRNLNLKPEGTLAQYYNGGYKSREGVYTSVVDLDIGDKDLHQCADAIMRLRAEYLWQTKQYDKIHFNFTNGHRVEYTEWMQGNRMEVKGNKTKWIPQAAPSNTYNDLWNYLELIFMYAGTASLEKEMERVELGQQEIGDVLIQGGHPGHAVIIVDKATHKETDKSVYLLAQSYMPAQEIQILINPSDKALSPWFEIEEGEIKTPEWHFHTDDLKRFRG